MLLPTFPDQNISSLRAGEQMTLSKHLTELRPVTFPKPGHFPGTSVTGYQAADAPAAL